LGTIAEIPHNLRGDLRIVRIEQRERKSGYVVLQLVPIIDPHLRRVFFGRGFVWRRPFKALRRHDLHPHALPDQNEIAGADEIATIEAFSGVIKSPGFTPAAKVAEVAMPIDDVTKIASARGSLDRAISMTSEEFPSPECWF
jgi:hypothetical protein